jgi:hypothetical protein
MLRSYVIEPVEGGWKMTLFEDGEEVGGGKGEENDYEDLLRSAEEFCGICYGITRDVTP